MKSSYIILIFLLSFLFISCSKNLDKKELIGKWKRTDTGLFFEFLDNNMVIAYEPQGVIPGSYTLEKNVIDMTFPNPGPTGIRHPDIKGKVEIKTYKMTITDPDDESKIILKLEKVNN